METTVQKHGSKAEDMNEKEKGKPCAWIFVIVVTIVIIDLLFLFLPVVRHKAVAEASK